jgi:hypothetical protein
MAVKRRWTENAHRPYDVRFYSFRFYYLKLYFSLWLRFKARQAGLPH